MIICGYQGIGKLTAAGKNNVIDLESSNFFVDGRRDDNWYIVYANIAKHLSDQGYVVMTSSHKVFRDYLDYCQIEYITISPSVELKEKWIEKLQSRYDAEPSDKNFKALMNTKNCYEENVKDLQKGSYCIIDDINYNLIELIENLKQTSTYF